MWFGVDPVRRLVHQQSGFARRAGADAADPTGVFAITRHPMMWSFAIWAIVHLMRRRHAKALVFDGAILFLALAGAAGQDRKKARLLGEAWHEWTAQTAFVPFTGGVAYPGNGRARRRDDCCSSSSTWTPSRSPPASGAGSANRAKARRMTRKFFGTDGIRGTTNSEPMTAETALRVGQAAGAHFLRGDHRHRVVIGKDTRLSGYMMELAMVAGFTSVGMDVVLLGPMPTPAVAMLTRSMRADLGVMISASHNPFADNGIKLFGPDGYKLSDEDEHAIEQRLEKGPKLAKPEMIGRARRIDDARGRYIHFAKSTFPEHLRLDGLKVVIDCANGAAYHVAPEALWELGAEVIPLGVTPNGLNINEDCGSTHPAAAAGDGGRERRRHRHRARRRRRPADRRRREGRDRSTATS